MAFGGSRGTWDRVELGDHAFDFVTRIAVDPGHSDRVSLSGWRRRGDEGEQVALVSSDAGRSWVPNPSAVEDGSGTDQAPNRRAVLSTAEGTLTFEVSPRGLWRLSSDASRTLVFPPPNLFPPLFVEERPLEARSPRAPISWEQWDAAIAHNSRGLAFARKGRHAEALRAYAQSWKANPDHWMSRYNAACSHARRGRPEEAMALLERLHEVGGYRALTLLAAGATDPDLEPLRSNRRFRELATATAPTPAWGPAMAEGARDEDEVLILSEASERLCLVRSRSSKEGPIRFARFDCDTGRARGELVGTHEDLAAILDDLGARRWMPVPEDDPSRAEVQSWGRAALAAGEGVVVQRSPTTRHVAAYLESQDSDTERVAISAWPGQPMVAFLPDEDQGELVSYGLPAVSEDGRLLAALSWENSGLSDISLSGLIFLPIRGRAGGRYFSLQAGGAEVRDAPRRFGKARTALESKRWRQLEPLIDKVGSDWLSEGIQSAFMDRKASILVEFSVVGITVQRAGSSRTWSRPWPRHIVEARGTTCDEERCEVPCETTQYMVQNAHLEPSSGALLLVVAFNSWSDLCYDPSPEHLVLSLPGGRRAGGWDETERQEHPGWLDVPDYREEADHLSEGQVEHIKEELGFWEPFFPNAPGVRALREVLEQHERKILEITP